MLPIGITCIDHTADEMWTFYKKKHDGRMKERYHVIAMMLDGKKTREGGRRTQVLDFQMLFYAVRSARNRSR